MLARSVTQAAVQPDKWPHEMKPQRIWAARAAALLTSAVVIVGIPVGDARGGATDPVLAIGRLRVVPVGTASIVDLTGAFAFDDMLQVEFPLNLVVYQGSTFVRLPVGGQVQVGDFAGLADGLSVGEIAALESAGQNSSDAEFLRVEPNRLQASLPDLFDDGIITAVVYVELAGEGGFTSNSVSVSVVGLVGGGP